MSEPGRSTPTMKDALLIEYEKLKDEQRARISFRENLFYIALIVVGAVFSSLLSISNFDVGYLAITPILFVISNTYYYNDDMVSQMNIYFREVLAPRVAAATKSRPEEVFYWETFNRTPRRIRRRIYTMFANLILYPGASAAGLAIFIIRKGHLDRVETAAAIICGLITALMLVQVLFYSDLFPERRR